MMSLNSRINHKSNKSIPHRYTYSLDKIILFSLGFIFIWFTIITLHVFHSISSTPTTPSSTTGIIDTRFQQFVQNRIKTNKSLRQQTNQQSSLLQRLWKRDYQQTAYVPQIILSDTIQDDNLKIPFPQSIRNEPLERILHPAIVMKSDSEDFKNHHSLPKDTYMEVPKFWNPRKLLSSLSTTTTTIGNDIRQYLGNYGDRLMTIEEASRIGSYTQVLVEQELQREKDKGEEEEEEDDEESEIEDEEQSKDLVPCIDDEYLCEIVKKDETKSNSFAENGLLETIYISIASYRDPRCPNTISSIFKRALYPERIRVGIVDQIILNEDVNCAIPEESCDLNPDQILCQYAHQIDVFEMNATLAVGPVFARHIGSRMYRGEYYSMQTDAHMEFVNGWDVDLITQWKSAKNEMAVLTTYPSNVYGHFDTKTGDRNTELRPLMCASDFEADYYEDGLEFLMHGQQPERNPEKEGVVGEPLLEPFWGAGFSFARGHFTVQVPYDQYLPMIFQGEEISIGLRAFSYGYDFYAPERSVIFHYYKTAEEKKNHTVKKFWEHESLYEGVGYESKLRLEGIIQMLTAAQYDDGSVRTYKKIEEQKYGIGKVRTIQKFLDTYGIDFEAKKVQHHLCTFVGARMQKLFTQHVRPDKMGIDYDKITFRFKDPTPQIHDDDEAIAKKNTQQGKQDDEEEDDEEGETED